MNAKAANGKAGNKTKTTGKAENKNGKAKEEEDAKATDSKAENKT